MLWDAERSVTSKTRQIACKRFQARIERCEKALGKGMAGIQVDFY